MKRLTITLFFLLPFIGYAQADLMIDFLMYDNATPPWNGSCLMTFGLDSTATDGIDEHLGEYPVPPDACCGWALNLCSMFDLPVGPDPTWVDYRFGELPYTGVKVHKILYCSDTSSTVVTIRCSLPPGASALLQDYLTGGYFINIEMIDSNEYHIYDPYIGSPFDLKLTVTYNNVVPVELISFNATLLETTVRLNWTTATETNNSGFEIERLQDSKIEILKDWEVIGFVPGFGTTTEPKSYSYIDDLSLTPNLTHTLRYRLKQINFDGSFTYSNEIEVQVDFTPKEFVLYQNYPNPFNPSTTIKFEIPGQARNDNVLVTLKVYDILGNEVTTLVNEEKQPGVYEVEFDASNLSSGIYVYQLKTGDFISIKKMVVLR